MKLCDRKQELGFRGVRPRGRNVEMLGEWNGRGFAAVPALHSQNCSLSGIYYCSSLHRDGGAICQIQFKRYSPQSHEDNTLPKVCVMGCCWLNLEHGFGGTRAEMIYIAPDDVRLGNQKSAEFCMRLVGSKGPNLGFGLPAPSRSEKGGFVRPLSLVGMALAEREMAMLNGRPV
jgi:hypothetical protein